MKQIQNLFTVILLFLFAQSALLAGTAETVAVSAAWPLNDPAAEGSGQTAITSGPITAFDQSFFNMRINGYTGAEESQRSDNRPSGGATEWPAEQLTRIDSVFVQFCAAPVSGTTLQITGISFEIGGDYTNYLKADVLYSVDSTFTVFNQIPDSLVLEGSDYPYPGHLLRADTLNPVNFDMNETVAENQKFYLRIYPWVNDQTSGLTGKYLLLKDVVISGVTEGEVVYNLADIYTSNISYISTTFATSGGNITSDGGSPVTAHGVVWNTSGSPTLNDSKTIDGDGSGYFTSQVTGLIPGETYFLRGYATNQAGTAYGNERTFTTLTAITVPTVVTKTARNRSANSAESGGYVIDWGGDSVSVRGVLWNTTGTPNFEDEVTEDGSGMGEFSSYLYPLTESTTYYVRAYAKNSTGTGYGSTIEFSTKEKQPDVIKTVDQHGLGDYTTVQEAFDDVPDFYTGKWTIRVNPGIYYEKLFLGENKVNVVLEGIHPDSTILTYDDYAGKVDGTSQSYSVAIEPDDFIAVSITFQNTVQNDGSFSGQQAVSLRVNGDRQSYYNCKLLGYQDTYYTWGGRGTGRIYMKDCFIEGSVDFIFGRDIVLFDSCRIHINRNGGTLTAAATEAQSKFGYVFRDCRITHDAVGFDGQTIYSFTLGRPWQNAPRTVFIRTEEPAALNPAGWSSWNVSPALYAEYQCYGAGADTSRRSTISRQLSDEEAKAYTIPNIFARESFPDFAFNWEPEQVDYISAVGDNPDHRSIPERFSLEENYPNPFNPRTTIVYHLPRQERVSLKIFNIMGQEVCKLIDNSETGGIKTVQWDGRDQNGHDLATGIYLYHFQAGSFSATRKMFLLK